MNRFALAAVAALTLSAPAFAGDYRAGGIEVRRPWTPPARSATIHQSSMTGGVSSMRALTGGLTIAPGAKVEFAPGGYHLMLMGLTRAQALGGKVPLTLVFDGGLRVKIDLS